jgi:iron complex outermembrane receptor protein
MKRRTVLCSVAGLQALIVGLAANSACAQQASPPPAAPDNQIGEVVVTAQKRTENLRDTPVSVAVVAPKQLEAAGVTTLDDLGKAVPSLVASPATTTLRPFYTLRGVSTNVITVGSPSGVAVMLDGVTLAPESLAARQLTDIASAEVLRGPQSTLGGRTASIGVINIVTRKPSNVFEARASVSATTDSEVRAQAFVAGPISDSVGFSLSGFRNRTEFVTRNLATGDNDVSKAAGVRGKLLFKPTDGLDITLSANYVDARDIGQFQAFVQLDPTARFRGAFAQSEALVGVTPGRGNTDYNTITTPGQHTKDQLYSAVVNYEVGDFIFSSITAKSHEDRDLRYDVYGQKIDWAARLSGGAYSWNNIQRSQLEIDGFSQEFRVASHDLSFGRVLAGLYYDHSKTGFQFDRPAFGTPIPLGAYREANNKSYAAYVRADFSLTDSTTLITGLRYNHDKIGYVYNLQYNTTPASNTTPFTRRGSDSFSTVVGDITLKQDIGARANVYATYSRGYKPKVYNLDATVTATNTFNPVDEEQVDNFEGGLKGDYFDRRVSLSLATFYTTYKNFQVQAVDPTTTVPTFQLTNAGKASTRGVELDTTVRPTRGLTLNGSLAYVDAKYDSFVGATCYSGQTAAAGCTTLNGASFQNLSGARLSNSPRWKLNAGAEQRFDLSSDLELTLGGVVNYQSQINFDPNKNPLATQDGYAIVNLSASVGRPDQSWSLTAFVNNVADKLYLSNISDVGGRWGNKVALAGWYGRDARRYAGVRLDAKF